MCKKSRSGSKIRDENPGSYSKSLETILGLKILKFLGADPDLGSGIPNLFDPGSLDMMASC
jgi:hypothetical protein